MFNSVPFSPVRVALYGSNGHQIQNQLKDNPAALWVAAAEVDELPEGVRRHEDLDSLLADPDVELISFCSPMRSEQGEQVVRALEAGKHVYAEKPCAMDEAVLDRISDAARRSGCIFHEMASTAFDQPYHTVREVVQTGVLGEVIQVLAQKSYPWGEWRPKDEAIDGGLATQVGVYCLRFAEHVAGLKTSSIELRETTLGNTVEGSDCKRAVSFLMTFENGAVGSAIANYACPETWTRWGYETLRIFGENGFVEVVNHGESGTLALNGEAPQALDFSAPTTDYFDAFCQEVRTGDSPYKMPLELELSPTRWVLRAKAGLSAQ